MAYLQWLFLFWRGLRLVHYDMNPRLVSFGFKSAEMKNYKVNMSLQVIPLGSDLHPYDIVDDAIKVIQASGIAYEVGPFETVMEGDYETLMRVIRDAQEACFGSGATTVLSHIKIEWHQNRSASIDEKVRKYKGEPESGSSG